MHQCIAAGQTPALSSMRCAQMQVSLVLQALPTRSTTTKRLFGTDLDPSKHFYVVGTDWLNTTSANASKSSYSFFQTQASTGSSELATSPGFFMQMSQQAQRRKVWGECPQRAVPCFHATLVMTDCPAGWPAIPNCKCSRLSDGNPAAMNR